MAQSLNERIRKFSTELCETENQTEVAAAFFAEGVFLSLRCGIPKEVMSSLIGLTPKSEGSNDGTPRSVD